VELRFQGKQKYKNYNTKTHTTDGSQRLQSKERDWSWGPKESSSLDCGGGGKKKQQAHLAQRAL